MIDRWQEALDYIFEKYENSENEDGMLLRHYIDTLQELIDNYSKLEKALDKAITMIDKVEYCPKGHLEEQRCINCNECLKKHILESVKE